eukprot:m.118882 g.118882  ORF g.118882 m.118882 type:complete len:154 (-) comp52025_c0_seq8:185-646(-)
MASRLRICFDFQAGRCNRANCRFDHIDSDDIVLSQFERMEIQKRLENELRLKQVDVYFAAESRQNLLPALQEMCLNLFGVEPATVTDCSSMLQTCFVHISDYVAVSSLFLRILFEIFPANSGKFCFFLCLISTICSCRSVRRAGLSATSAASS